MEEFVIETERLRLRQPRLADFEPFIALYTDPAAMRFIGDGMPGARQDIWHRLLRLAGHWRFFGYGIFVVEEKDGGRFAGNVGLAHFERELGDDFDPYPEASWIMASQAWGKGFASEAASAALRWFEETHGAQRTVCIIDPANAGSLRIAEKLGFAPIPSRQYRGTDVLAFERTG